MMTSQWSTSISNGVLAVTCLSAVWRLHQASANWHLHLLALTIPVYETPVFAMTGFLSIFVAASLGVIRFGTEKPSAKLVSCYQSAMWFASCVGLCFLAMQYNLVYEKYFFCGIHLMDLVIVFLVSYILPQTMVEILHKFQQAAVLMSIIIVSFFGQNWHGVLGAQLIAVAGLSIGTEGKLFGFPALDAFHYTFACAVYLLSRGLVIVDR